MVIIGASGHGKVIYDCAKAIGLEVTAFADNNPDKVGSFLGIPVVCEKEIPMNEEIISGIGNNKTRKMLTSKMPNSFFKMAHLSAIVSEQVTFLEGTVILHGAVVQTGTTIGRHVIVNTSASIDHDCIIEDFVHIAPNSTLCGGVIIGEGTLIGAGAIITPNIKIGKWVAIGAGTVIINDVPDGTTVVGNPGRTIQ